MAKEKKPSYEFEGKLNDLPELNEKKEPRKYFKLHIFEDDLNKTSEKLEEIQNHPEKYDRNGEYKKNFTTMNGILNKCIELGVNQLIHNGIVGDSLIFSITNEILEQFKLILNQSIKALNESVLSNAILTKKVLLYVKSLIVHLENPKAFKSAFDVPYDSLQTSYTNNSIEEGSDQERKTLLQNFTIVNKMIQDGVEMFYNEPIEEKEIKDYFETDEKKDKK